MANINKVKVGSTDPNAVMFNDVSLRKANPAITFGSIIAKDNSNDASLATSNSVWQINDGWEVEIISPKKIAIKKFKIDTWGLRQIIPSPHTDPNYNKFRARVTGLAYVHQNVVCHTAGSTTPDGFTKAFAGTAGYNQYWYPGQFTSGRYFQGLGIQFGIGYYDDDNRRDDSLQMGKHPWDIGNTTYITDTDVTGSTGDTSYRALTIGLYGGVQNATAWHDETGDAYRIYDISTTPIYIDIGFPDSTLPIDPSTKECWKINHSSTTIYSKDKTVENAWIKYKLVTSTTSGKYNIKTVKNNTGYNLIALPTVTDLSSWLTSNNISSGSTLNQVRWNIAFDNTEYWDTIKDWYSENTIGAFISLFESSGIEGSVTINGGNSSYESAEQMIYKTGITNVTINLPNSHTITSGHDMFKQGTSLESVVFNVADGNPVVLKDVSGMFANCPKLTSIPSNICYENAEQSSVEGLYTMNSGYMFDYASKLTSVPEPAIKNVIRSRIAVQMFYYNDALTTIGPTLDWSCLHPSKANDVFYRCNKLTSVKIQNLNHGDWVFDGYKRNSLCAGLLDYLDKESVQYLFNNLSDLTNYNADDDHSVDIITNVPKVSSANLYCPPVWFIPYNVYKMPFASGNNCFYGYCTLGTTKRYPTTSSASFANMSAVGKIRIHVSGMVSGDVLCLGTGTYSTIQTKITENGIFTATTGLNTLWYFRLYNTEDASITSPVFITRLEWEETTVDPIISDTMIGEAKLKGWNIYSGNTLIS